MAAALAAGPESPSAPLTGDKYITIDTVELPASGVDPRNMSLVLNQVVRSCHKSLKPLVEQNGTLIRILPQSEAQSPHGRAPCSTPLARSKQVVELGSLARGTYRVQVITADSKIFKVLNIY